MKLFNCRRHQGTVLKDMPCHIYGSSIPPRVRCRENKLFNKRIEGSIAKIKNSYLQFL